MDQQTWIITFSNEADDVDSQANTLQEFLLETASNIEVTQKPKSEYAQGGWVDLIIKVVGAGGATTVVAGIINAISTWIKSTHSASINIEVKEGQITKVEAQNITGKNFERALSVLQKQLQTLNSKE